MNSLNKYVAIITISMAVGGVLFSVLVWIDNRYSKSYDFANVTYKIITANYTQQIAVLNKRLLYLLEFENKNKDEIKSIRDQIQIVKQDRDSMLQNGHFRFGDSIFLNNEIISDKYTRE